MLRLDFFTNWQHKGIEIYHDFFKIDDVVEALCPKRSKPACASGYVGFMSQSGYFTQRCSAGSITARPTRLEVSYATPCPLPLLLLVRLCR
jgi:hypothetical protein